MCMIPIYILKMMKMKLLGQIIKGHITFWHPRFNNRDTHPNENNNHCNFDLKNRKIAPT